MRANTDHLPPSLTRAVKVVKETDRQIHKQADSRRETQLPPSSAPAPSLDRRRRTARISCMLCCVRSLRIAVTRYFMGVAPARSSTLCDTHTFAV